MSDEPKEGERFIFESTLEFQTWNREANKLGLRARIEKVEFDFELDDKRFSGVWVKNDSTSSKRS